MQPVVEGLVPLLDELESAVYEGYRVADWWELPRNLQVLAVAHYYTHIQLGTHTEDAIASAQERAYREPD